MIPGVTTQAPGHPTRIVVALHLSQPQSLAFRKLKRQAAIIQTPQLVTTRQTKIIRRALSLVIAPFVSNTPRKTTLLRPLTSQRVAVSAPGIAYTAEDGTTAYTAEDGVTAYTTEGL
jgi:hypothetical protein